MESSSQTFVAVGASILSALATFLLFAFAPLFLDMREFPSSFALLFAPVFAFLMSFLFLYLTQATKPKEKQLSAPAVATASTTVAGFTALGLGTVFLLPWFRSLISSAVPNVFAFTPEQLLLRTKESPDTAGVESEIRNQKQSVLDDGVAYAYFTFWGSLFANVMIFGSA
jgi:hypothetical protein